MNLRMLVGRIALEIDQVLAKTNLRGNSVVFFKCSRKWILVMHSAISNSVFSDVGNPLVVDIDQLDSSRTCCVVSGCKIVADKYTKVG